MNTVGNLKDSVAGLLTGVNLDSVTGANQAIERAARKLVQKADVPEASDVENITLYDGVYDYPMDTNIFGEAIIDVRPQGESRSQLDTVVKRPVSLFDREKHTLPSGYAISMAYDKGTPIIRIASPKPKSRVTVDSMQQTTGWTAAGTAASLVQDDTVYYEQPASLRFSLAGSGTGTLTKAINSINISSYEDVGVGFLAMRIPDGATVSDLTSVAIRIGSSASDYNEVSNTTGFVKAWVAGDWLLTAFDFSGASETGTPDWENIDYAQVRFAHTGAFTNFRVGGLWLALPSPHEVLFQTAAIFLASSALNKTITDDDDQIILNDAAYLLFEHEAALQIAVQGRATESAANMRAILYGGEDQVGLYNQYRADNPSQELRTVGYYH